MTEKQIATREQELQSYLRIHPRLNLEFKALISKLFREHSIDVTAETLSRLTLALDPRGADLDSDGGGLQEDVEELQEEQPPDAGTPAEDEAKPDEK